MLLFKSFFRNLQKKQNYNVFWSFKNKESDKETGDFSQMKTLNDIISQIKLENQKKPFLLPDKTDGKLTVVLEMDEVLLYTFYPDEQEAYLNQPLRDYDFYVEYAEYQTYLNIYKRKNLDQFLKYLNQNCEPVIFSTGIQSYVDLVMDLVDPNKLIQHRFYQDSCDKIILPEEQIEDFIKDMGRLNRDLKRLIYIDSKSFSFISNPENAVPISEFVADNSQIDDDLSKLTEFIEQIKILTDVQPTLDEIYGIKEALKESNLI